MNIVEYDEIRAKLDEVKETSNFLPDVTSDEGYQKSKRVSLDIGKLRSALDKVRKERKAYFLEGGREVDKQAKSIDAELEQYQTPHKDAYKELDNLTKEREAARKAALEERVSTIRDLPEAMRDMSSDEVKMALESLQQEECLDFYEYTEHALKARNSSREALSKMFGEKLQQEKEAEELAELRKEAEERAVKDREEEIKKEAAAKAEAEKQAAIKREQEAKEAALRAEQEKVAAEKRAIEQEKIAEENRIKAEKQAKIDTEKAVEAARLAEIERQENEKRIAAEEEAKREANKKHVGAIRKAAKEALMSECGLSEERAKNVILAINSDKIPSVTLRY